MKARYFRLMDTKDWDGMAEVFAPDVRDRHDRVRTARSHHGVADFMPYLRDEHRRGHHRPPRPHARDHPAVARRRRRGIWAMEDKLWWPEGSPLVHLHGYGHYHETYEKVDGAVAHQDAEADPAAPRLGDGKVGERRLTRPHNVCARLGV